MAPAYLSSLFRPEYDVLRDGRHFVVLRPAEESPEIVVVLNWLTELRTHVAGPKTGKAP